MDVTPRMILGIDAETNARAIASFHQAGHHATTSSKYVLLGMADSMAAILRDAIGSDDANRLIGEQITLLKDCIAQMQDPAQLGREVDAYLKSIR